jgi:hypothetical protein
MLAMSKTTTPDRGPQPRGAASRSGRVAPAKAKSLSRAALCAVFATFVCVWATENASANEPFLTCPDGHADLTGNGEVNVSDIQCAIQVALGAMASPLVVPPCLAVGAQADSSCGGGPPDLLDVQVVVARALSLPLSVAVDADADGCLNACDTVLDCPRDACDVLECGVHTCGASEWDCGNPCAEGDTCVAGFCQSGGSCFGACGSLGSDGCFCDAACFVAGDCCDDICFACQLVFPAICQPGALCGDGTCSASAGETCGSCPDDCGCPFGKVCNGEACVSGVGQCANSCGGKSKLADCWCDATCAANGDCCDDLCVFCGVLALPQCAPLPPELSCAGACGQSDTPKSCYCDSECVFYDDCCVDFCESCSSTFPDLCAP